MRGLLAKHYYLDISVRVFLRQICIWMGRLELKSSHSPMWIRCPLILEAKTQEKNEGRTKFHQVLKLEHLPLRAVDILVPGFRPPNLILILSFYSKVSVWDSNYIVSFTGPQSADLPFTVMGANSQWISYITFCSLLSLFLWNTLTHVIYVFWFQMFLVSGTWASSCVRIKKNYFLSSLDFSLRWIFMTKLLTPEKWDL